MHTALFKRKNIFKHVSYFETPYKNLCPSLLLGLFAEPFLHNFSNGSTNKAVFRLLFVVRGNVPGGFEIVFHEREAYY